MTINMTNKNDLRAFVEDNISLINTQISEFSKEKHSEIIYDSTDIKRWLLKKFKDELCLIRM